MHNPILLVLIGTLFTAIIQASAAATGVFIAFLTTGVIHSIDQSFFLVMGANIGTCIDAVMASIGTNAKGKRIALFHVLSSVIGAGLFTIVLIIFRIPVVGFFERLFPGQPQFSLATYNLIYNTLYTLLLLLFIDPLVNLVTRLIKDKDAELEELLFIDDHFLQTPSVAIEQALKELYAMLTLAKENIYRAYTSLINEDMSERKTIDDVEHRIDYLTKELTNFFIKISSVTKAPNDEKLIAGLHHVTNDIERLGDYALLIARETSYMKKYDVGFLDKTKDELELIYEKISELFDLGYDAFTKQKTDDFEQISELHQKIRDLIKDTRDEHVARLSCGMYPVEVSKSIYSVLFSLQRIADHIVNIAFSIRSTTGSKKEALQAIESEKWEADLEEQKSYLNII